MKKPLIAVTLMLVAGLGAYSFRTGKLVSFWGSEKHATEPVVVTKPGKTMRAFASDAELKEYFTKFAEKRKDRGSNLGMIADGAANTASQAPPSPASKNRRSLICLSESIFACLPAMTDSICAIKS